MEFSDKLKLLMEITDTTNKALAKRLIVDPSMISQLRTGARNIAKKNEHLNNMAFFFAEKCQTPERLNLLIDLIPDANITRDCDVSTLSDIILSYLSGEEPMGFSRSARPDDTDLFKTNPHVHASELIPHPVFEKPLVICRDSNDKKFYMQKLFEYFMSMDSQNVIYFSSEEVVDWIYDDPVFYKNFRSWCIALSERGFTIVRIMKPMENKELFLKNILLWLPIYMTGRVHLYYYPHFRDDVYRQTIIAMENAASYCSSGLARNGQLYYSFFSADQELSKAYVKQLKDYLSYCRPSFYICRTEASIAETFSYMMNIRGDRISKSFHLSPESIPFDQMVEYLSDSSDEDYRIAAATVRRLYTARPSIDNRTVVIDMCTLASSDDVRRGRVQLQLPGYVNHKPLHYNAELYVMHLKHILDMMETNPNYFFYPLSPSEFGEFVDDYSPLTIIDNQAMLLVTEHSVLHFTQPEIIHTLYEHLYSQSRYQAKHSHSRTKTMVMIRKLIGELEAEY
jgi:hypothetical protein